MDSFSSSFWHSAFASHPAYWEPTTSLPPVDSPAALTAVDNALTTPLERQSTLAESASNSGEDVTVSFSQSALAASSNWTMSLSSTASGADSAGSDSSQNLELNLSGEGTSASFITWFAQDGSIEVSQFGSETDSYRLSVVAATSQSSFQVESSFLASEAATCGEMQQVDSEIVSNAMTQSSDSVH